MNTVYLFVLSHVSHAKKKLLSAKKKKSSYLFHSFLANLVSPFLEKLSDQELGRLICFYSIPKMFLLCCCVRVNFNYIYSGTNYFGGSSRRTNASSYIDRYSYTDQKSLHIWVYIYKIWMSNPRLASPNVYVYSYILLKAFRVILCD